MCCRVRGSVLKKIKKRNLLIENRKSDRIQEIKGSSWPAVFTSSSVQLLEITARSVIKQRDFYCICSRSLFLFAGIIRKEKV